MKCPNCQSRLVKVDRREEITEPDEDATEGQLADYEMALESGFAGDWGVGVVEYNCKTCRRGIQIQSEILEDHMKLVRSWHERAKRGDIFNRFSNEFIAFNSLLKNVIYYDLEQDRPAIQRLKRDTAREAKYRWKIKRSRKLFLTWRAIALELRKRPLHNSARDLDNPEVDGRWNCSSDHQTRNLELGEGVIHSPEDWVNMVEFWYGVRNNLFHGGKNPTDPRDIFLVKNAYETLRVFVWQEIQSNSAS